MVYLSSLRGMSTNIFTINSSFYPLRPLFIYSPSSHLLIHTRIVVRSRIRRISSLSLARSLLFSPILFAISNLAINRRVPVNRGETRVNLASERASERASIRRKKADRCVSLGRVARCARNVSDSWLRSTRQKPPLDSTRTPGRTPLRASLHSIPPPLDR